MLGRRAVSAADERVATASNNANSATTCAPERAARWRVKKMNIEKILGEGDGRRCSEGSGHRPLCYPPATRRVGQLPYARARNFSATRFFRAFPADRPDNRRTRADVLGAPLSAS